MFIAIFTCTEDGFSFKLNPSSAQVNIIHVKIATKIRWTLVLLRIENKTRIELRYPLLYNCRDTGGLQVNLVWIHPIHQNLCRTLKAFDTIDHKIFLDKLACFGCSNSTTQFYGLNLTFRTDHLLSTWERNVQIREICHNLCCLMCTFARTRIGTHMEPTMRAIHRTHKSDVVSDVTTIVGLLRNFCLQKYRK